MMVWVVCCVCRPSTGTTGSGGSFQSQAEQLAHMGFDLARALEILDIVHGNMDLAIEMLSQ